MGEEGLGWEEGMVNGDVLESARQARGLLFTESPPTFSNLLYRGEEYVAHDPADAA